MQIFVDANNQVMAVYKGCRGNPAAWPGMTEADAPADMPASRDLKVTVADGKVTGWEASENPVKPAVRARPPSTVDIIVEAAKAAGLTLDLEAAKQRLESAKG